MNKFTWTIFAVIVVAIFGIAIIASNKEKIDVANVDVSSIQVGNKQNGNIADHVYGNNDSKVTLISYGDFSCSHCAQIHPQIDKIVEEYKDKIKFVFRNFLLSTSAYPNSKMAASVAEAAGLQGQYWEMYDLIYNNQSSWYSLSGEARTDKFLSYATQLGLDTDKLKTDIASPEISAKISYDQALGAKSNITGTPSFFLNGKELDSNIWSDETKLKEALDQKLAE